MQEAASSEPLTLEELEEKQLKASFQDDRSPTSSGNESDDSSDVEMPAEAAEVATKLPASKTEVSAPPAASCSAATASSGHKTMPALNYQTDTNSGPSTSTAAGGGGSADSKYVYSAASIANIPQKMLRQLIQSGHLQVHAEEGK